MASTCAVPGAIVEPDLSLSIFCYLFYKLIDNRTYIVDRQYTTLALVGPAGDDDGRGDDGVRRTYETGCHHLSTVQSVLTWLNG